jgi:hypothetical protein|mmetsp:Transcript_61604/g.101785  ORF Transcript_61604/g.101785 Transcript_61604/m.101785 type:complete len:100 (-) Transcript_61604:5514-5813(-)
MHPINQFGLPGTKTMQPQSWLGMDAKVRLAGLKAAKPFRGFSVFKTVSVIVNACVHVSELCVVTMWPKVLPYLHCYPAVPPHNQRARTIGTHNPGLWLP